MDRKTLNKFYKKLKEKGIKFKVGKMTEEEYRKVLDTPIPFDDLGSMTQTILLEEWKEKGR